MVRRARAGGCVSVVTYFITVKLLIPVTIHSTRLTVFYYFIVLIY